MTREDKNRIASDLLINTECAVVIIDVQNDYCHPQGSCAIAGKDVSGAGGIIAPTKHLIKIAEAYHIPVIYVKTLHEDCTDSEVWCKRINGHTNYICRKDTWGAQFYELSPGPSDLIIEKYRYSAFIGTKLETVLRTLKIETLLVTGVATNVCVESTIRDGFMLDHNVVLIEDCCAAFSRQEHEAAVQNVEEYFGSVLKVSQVEEILEQQDQLVAAQFS